MFSLKSIVLFTAAVIIGSEASEAVPAAYATPAIAAAHVGYSQAIPQNVLPFASQVSIINRALATPYAVAAPAVAASAVATPFATPVPSPFATTLAAPYPASAQFAAPLAARFATPFSAPYFGVPAPAPVLPAPYATAYPYAAPNFYTGPLTAPAFVR